MERRESDRVRERTNSGPEACSHQTLPGLRLKNERIASVPCPYKNLLDLMQSQPTLMPEETQRAFKACPRPASC